ncbi:MAG TPA: histidine kinase [Thermoanaerobaculia bacterium]|jgi:hypothetical protein
MLKRWLLYFAIATLVGLYFATQLAWVYPPPVRRSWPDAITINLAYYWTWLFVLPVILAVARRFRFSPQRWAVPLLAHLGVSVAITLVQLALASGALIALGMREGTMGFGESIAVNFHSSYPTYWVIVFAFYAWDYFRESRAHALRTAEVSERLAHAELDALRAQLDPHFLFNTLNSISSLMYTDVQAADQMMTRLGELLRAAMERKGDQEVALRDELVILCGYVEIEKIRFEERLAFELDVAPEALDARVPPLLLQPLIENAIRHGISRRPEGGKLEVRARVAGDQVRITVTDDGFGATSDDERVGLGNTRARLQALYGDRASLKLERGAVRGTVAEIVLPFRPAA